MTFDITDEKDEWIIENIVGDLSNSNKLGEKRKTLETQDIDLFLQNFGKTQTKRFDARKSSDDVYGIQTRFQF